MKILKNFITYNKLIVTSILSYCIFVEKTSFTFPILNNFNIHIYYDILRRVKY